MIGDKGYDSFAIEDRVLQEDVAAHVPGKANAVETWPYDEEAYKERNRVEPLINEVKQFRRVATRYDKLDMSFLAIIKLALVLIKVRSIVNTT